MKKILSIILAAAVAVMVISCSGGSPKAKADDYMKKIKAAAEKEDLEEVAKICKEFDQWYETLGDADKASLKDYKDYTDLMIGLKSDLDDLENSLGDWGLDDEDSDLDESSDVETEAGLYLESIYNNLKDGNFDAAENLLNDVDEWAENLSEEENEKVEAVIAKFMAEHPDFFELIEGAE
ncbi:MAG: hypothetical protein J6W74_01170 [Bacteroidales bacterium]|nr:hypothetical protein [Bacteroidales bacterium]